MAEAVEVGQKRALRDEELEAPEAKQARQDGQANGQAGAVTTPTVAAPQAAAPVPASVQADAAEVLAVAAQPAAAAAAPAAAPAAQAPAATTAATSGAPAVASPAAGSKPPPRQPIGPDGQPLPFKLPADVILKQEIPMPRRMASCVIGVRGTTVTRLRRESSTKIHVRQGQPQENEQVVEIEGTIDAVVNCMRLIEDILAAEDPNYRMAPKPLVTCRFMVTSDMVGPAIIGKQGTHAKHVRERTGVKIEVERAQDGDNRQSILLIGKADGVREAYHILLNNIRKYGTNLPAGAVPPAMTIPRTGAYAASGRTPTAAAGAPPPPPRSYSPEVRRNTYAAPPPPPSRGYRAEEAYQPPPPPNRSGVAAAADPYAAYAAPAPAQAAPAAAAYAAPAAAAPAAAAGAAGQPPVIYLMGPNGQLIPAVVRYETAPASGAAPAAGATATYAAQPAAAAAGAQYQQVVYQQPAQAQAASGYTVADPNAASGTAAAGQQGSYLQAGLLQQLLQQGTSAAQQQPAAAAATTSQAQVAAGYSMGGSAGQQLQFQGYSTSPQGYSTSPQVQYQTAQAAQPGAAAAAPAAGQYTTGSTGFVQYTYAPQ